MLKTTAIQRVGLTDDVDLRYVKSQNGDGYTLQGSSALTLFAPTNLAFEHLPLKLRLFLFSPFGQHVLRKVLEYHIIPNLVIHSGMTCFPMFAITFTLAVDYQYNSSASEFSVEGTAQSSSYGKVISDAHFKLPTRLEDHCVHAHVRRYEFALPVPGPDKPSVVKTEVRINHHDVLVSDVVTSNAAVHIVDRLLDPRQHHAHDHEHGEVRLSNDPWQDWEDWLVDWAESV